MSSPLIVFIESNTSGSGRLFLDAAVRRGLRPVLMARDPCRYPFANDHAVRVDTDDLASLLEACRALNGDGRILAILSSSEYYVPAAAHCAHAFGLPGPNADAVTRCRDKSFQRAILDSANVPGPRYEVVRTESDAMHCVEKWGLPLVAKPILGSGSLGVRLCRNESELVGQVRLLLQPSEQIRGGSEVRPGVLVETYLNGDEFSVEIFDGQAVGVTRKHLGGHPEFVEIGHDFPATIPEDHRNSLTDTAITACNALCLDYGPVHAELRLLNGIASVVEINPRLAGGMIPRIVAKATGIDLIELTLDRALGRPYQIRRTNDGGASIRFLVPTSTGHLASIHLEDARRIAGPDDEMEIYRPPGSPVEHHGDFRDRIGHVIAVGENPHASAEQADAMLAAIEIDVRNDTPLERDET